MHGRRRHQTLTAGPSRGRASRASRRGAWLHLLAVLFAYALALSGSPVGQAGFLWMHLATAHHATPAASLGSASAHSFPAKIVKADSDDASRADEDAVIESSPALADVKDHGHAHEHGHAHVHDAAAADRHARPERPSGHHHDDPPAHGAREDTHLPVAPVPAVAADAPHEHGGTWHTHQPHPVDDADVLTNGISKFYVASCEVPPQPRGSGRAPDPSIMALPSEADPAVEAPPPRLAR
jgi:hypothetical protein